MKDNRYRTLLDKTKPDSSLKERIEDKVYSLKFKFEVGNEEKHMIDFTVNQFWGYVDIRIDGHPYIQEKLRKVIYRQNWTFNITVGTDEKHDVRIELVRSLFPIGLRECTAWVYMDGEKKGEYNGKLSARDKLFRGMSPHKKAVIILVSLSVLLFIISLLVYCWPIRIDREMEGILFRGGPSEPEYSETMYITVNGKYYRKIFTNDKFVGQIYIGDLHPDVSEEVLKQELVLDFYKGMPASLMYWKINVGTFSDIIRTGYIFMEPGAKAIVMLVVEKDESGKDVWSGGNGGLFYASPCSNREEALSIVNGLIHKIWSREVKPIE